MRSALYAAKASCPASVSTDCGTKKPIGHNLSLGEGFTSRVSFVLIVICLLAGSGLVCVFETAPAIAKQKSTVVKKDKKSNIVQKNKSLTDHKNKQKSLAAKRRKSIVSAKQEAHTLSEVRTPIDKHDCIAAAQVFYAKAQTLADRTKQSIPQEFHRIVSKLDEFCGEEEFEHARVDIDWMNACLQNFTGDKKAEFCSSNESYFCALDPHSNTCMASEARASD